MPCRETFSLGAPRLPDSKMKAAQGQHLLRCLVTSNAIHASAWLSSPSLIFVQRDWQSHMSSTRSVRFRADRRHQRNRHIRPWLLDGILQFDGATIWTRYAAYPIISAIVRPRKK